MANILNMDRCNNPRPVTFVSPINGLERGIFVEIIGMAENNVWLNGGEDFEAYKVQLASSSTKVENLLIHTTVPKQYDERLDERDFVANEGGICRGHYITTGDEYTFALNVFNSTPSGGNKVGLGADGKLAVGEENAIGVVVRVYNFNGQESAMVRFF